MNGEITAVSCTKVIRENGGLKTGQQIHSGFSVLLICDFHIHGEL